MNVSATPEWLQDNGDAPATTGSGVDPFDGVTTETGDDGKANESSSRSFFSCSFRSIMVSLISIIFLALFVYSATTQGNDIDGIQWIIFYAINAAVPAIFLLNYLCCFPALGIYLLSGVSATWSIVYIVISALKVKDTPTGGATNGTGDNDGQTLREEYIFELAGASIALFSSLYHAVLTKCCAKKGDDTKELE